MPKEEKHFTSLRELEQLKPPAEDANLGVLLNLLQGIKTAVDKIGMPPAINADHFAERVAAIIIERLPALITQHVPVTDTPPAEKPQRKRHNLHAPILELLSDGKPYGILEVWKLLINKIEGATFTEQTVTCTMLTLWREGKLTKVRKGVYQQKEKDNGSEAAAG